MHSEISHSSSTFVIDNGRGQTRPPRPPARIAVPSLTDRPGYRDRQTLALVLARTLDSLLLSVCSVRWGRQRRGRRARPTFIHPSDLVLPRREVEGNSHTVVPQGRQPHTHTQTHPHLTEPQTDGPVLIPRSTPLVLPPALHCRPRPLNPTYLQYNTNHLEVSRAFFPSPSLFLAVSVCPP